MPKNGKVVSFGPKSTTATKVASGSPLLVDVEFGRGHTLYAGGGLLTASAKCPRRPQGQNEQVTSVAVYL
jgi:hypothetical protein